MTAKLAKLAKPKQQEEICTRLADGEPLRQICRSDGMPSWKTVYRWMEEDPDFATRIARARIQGFDAIAEDAIEIADDSRNDWMDARAAEGDEQAGKFNGEHVQRSKLRIETRLKLLAKWDPKRYGEKLALGGADDLPPIRTASDEQLAARIKVLQDKLNAKG